MLCSDKVTNDPYQGVGYIDNGEALCTGTLLSAHVVLTAGHCVYGRNPGDIRFTLSPNPNTEANVSYARASRAYVHPYYNPGEESDPGVDVAVIQLGDAGYEYGVTSFFSLGSEALLQQGSVAYNVGYGIQNDGSSGIKHPKPVQFSSLQSVTAGRTNINGGIIQVRRGQSGEIGCAGDSGSPLLVQANGHTSIVGVYSTSESAQNYPEDYDCRSGIQLGDYISVDAFRAWVGQYALSLESTADQASCGM